MSPSTHPASPSAHSMNPSTHPMSPPAHPMSTSAHPMSHPNHLLSGAPPLTLNLAADVFGCLLVDASASEYLERPTLPPGVRAARQTLWKYLRLPGKPRPISPFSLFITPHFLHRNLNHCNKLHDFMSRPLAQPLDCACWHNRHHIANDPTRPRRGDFRHVQRRALW